MVAEFLSGVRILERDSMVVIINVKPINATELTVPWKMVKITNYMLYMCSYITTILKIA